MHIPASLSPLSYSLRKARRAFMLWSFDRLYHEFAWCYDLVAAVVSGGYWSRWTVACVPFLAGERVLEIGCGTGYLQRELDRQRIPHVGLDASAQMLHGAKRRLGPTGRLIQARSPWLPVPSAYFSDVVATFPAPYLLEATTLTEVRRVLRANGRLVIVDGAAWQPRPSAAIGSNDEPAFDDTHYRRPLTAQGFEVTTHQVAVGPTTIAVIVARPTS